MAVSLLLIKDVDMHVRDCIDYEIDFEVYGELDRWGVPIHDIDGDGRWEDDCDGSAFLARALMRGREVPGLRDYTAESDAVRRLRASPAAPADIALATCHTGGLVGRINHLVLLVAADDGHWYTCGDTADRWGIRNYEECPYSWFEWISQPGDWRRFS
jgi:hypothetical protein